MTATNNYEVGIEFFGLVLDRHDGAAFDHHDRGFNLVVPAEGLESLRGIVEDLLAVVVVVDVDGRVWVACGVEESEACAERFGNGGGGLGDGDGFFIETDGAKDVADRPVEGVAGVRGGPDRA